MITGSLSITITPVDIELPSLELLAESIHLNAGAVTILTSKELNLEDPDTADGSLHFVITVRASLIVFFLLEVITFPLSSSLRDNATKPLL